jgi:hypothetical protein
MGNTGYMLYITNFVAEIIYHGDPNAPPGSDAQELYVPGVRMGSLSILAMYGVLVVYNLFHDRVFNRIGEFLRVEEWSLLKLAWFNRNHIHFKINHFNNTNMCLF